jgi:hypothetical protein
MKKSRAKSYSFSEVMIVISGGESPLIAIPLIAAAKKSDGAVSSIADFTTTVEARLLGRNPCIGKRDVLNAYVLYVREEATVKR